MIDQILQIINRIQEAANQIRTSNNLMHETLHGIADDLEAAIRPQWVPVNTPPYHSRNLLVCYRYPDGKQDQDAAKYVAGLDMWFFAAAPDGAVVTHWHEIEYPEPPEVNQ